MSDLLGVILGIVMFVVVAVGANAVFGSIYDRLN
mgnify:CR=1 FL=1